MHEELSELRRTLRAQEDMHARTRSELEAARLAPQLNVQHAPSSIPISSRTTESGWECISKDRVSAFPVGVEVRSPEVVTPSHRSPANREKFVSAEAIQGMSSSVVEESAPVRLAPRTSSSSVSPDKNIAEPNGGRAVRDRQLNEMLRSLGITGRSSSSSYSGSKEVDHDGDVESDIAVAKLVVEDAKLAQAPKTQESSSRDAQMRQLEYEYLEQIAELRTEMEKAQKAEQRLRLDRDEWRLVAENLQAPNDGNDGDEDEDYDDVGDPPAYDTRGADPSPDPDGGNDDGNPPRKRGKGADPDPPDGDDPDGGDDPEVTEVKISRREADKVVVPSFPTVTHLDNWMAQCIANVLSACADPNQEEWMRWLSPAFRPHPDIEGLNDSGHKKFKSIDVKLGVAMTSMLRAGSDKAADLYLEVNRKANDYVRSFEGKIIKGRQIIAMMYESFRTRDRLDMIDYFVKLQYQGDNKLHQFKQTWLEILNRMREEDIPSEKALRDRMCNKIKDSPAMKMELGQ